MRKGFTLIEAMLAGAILAVGCLGVLSMVLTVIRHNNESQEKAEVTYLADILLDRLEYQTKCNPGAAAVMQSEQPLFMIVNTPKTRVWSAPIRYSANGEFLDSNPDIVFGKPYFVSVLLHPNDAFPNNTYRGAMRIAWSKDNAACVQNDFTNFDTTPNIHCNMMTIPFAIER